MLSQLLRHSDNHGNSLKKSFLRKMTFQSVTQVAQQESQLLPHFIPRGGMALLDFPGSGLFKMSSKIEGKAKVTTCSWNDIKGQITTLESYYSLAKNSCFTAIKNFEKRKILWGDFRYLEVLEGSLPTKHFNKEPSSWVFFTALDPTEYWGMIREWVKLFLQSVK